MQWADSTSLALLGQLLRRVDRVSIVAAGQYEGPAGLVPESFAVPPSDFRHIRLGLLPTAAIRSLFGDPMLAQVIVDQAEHTPFALTELVAALASEGAVVCDERGYWCLRTPGDAAHARAIVAAGLRHAVEARLAKLPGRWRDVLAMIALLDRSAPPALLADARGWTPREVLDCLDGLSRAGLLRAGPQGWELRHRLSGQVLADTLHPTDEARLHALLAGALQQRGADAAEVAGHLLAGGDRVGAALSYATAARRKLDRGCDEEAMRLAGAGLALEPPGRSRAVLLEVRGEVHRRHGRFAEARTDLETVLQDLDDPPGRCRVLAGLAILQARTVDAACGDDLVDLAINEARGRPDALGQALTAGAIIDLTAGNLARAEQRSQQARQALEQACDSHASARLLCWQAMASFMGGRLREAVSRFGHLAYLPVAQTEELRLWSPRATRGHALAFLSQPEAGLAEIDETLAWARTADYLASQSSCLWHRSEALTFAGRAGEAVEAAQEALDIATRIRHAEWIAASLRGLGLAWEAEGNLTEAEAAFRRSLRVAEGEPLFAGWASARLGALLTRLGRLGEAAPHVRAALSSGTPLTRHEARWAQAELLAARRKDEACRATATASLRAAQDSGYLILVPRLRELAGL